MWSRIFEFLANYMKYVQVAVYMRHNIIHYSRNMSTTTLLSFRMPCNNVDLGQIQSQYEMRARIWKQHRRSSVYPLSVYVWPGLFMFPRSPLPVTHKLPYRQKYVHIVYGVAHETQTSPAMTLLVLYYVYINTSLRTESATLSSSSS